MRQMDAGKWSFHIDEGLVLDEQHKQTNMDG